MGESKKIGCFRWLGAISYILFGIGFLTYIFSEENEVIGYYDILGIIIFFSIIVYLLNLRIKHFINFIQSSFKVILFLGNLYLIAVLVKVNEKGISDFENFNIHLTASLITSVLSVTIFIFFYIKPRITARNKKIKEEKAIKELIRKGQNDVAINNENFIKKLQEVHGDRFDYKDVVLETFMGLKSDKTLKIHQNRQIELFCKKHEVVFKEYVSVIFHTNGCERCKIDSSYNSAKKEKVGEVYKSSQKYVSLFKDRLNEIFNEKYDFSEVNYRGMNNKVSVNCPQHGTFITIPKNLLKGAGCPICARERNASENKSNDIKINKGIKHSNEKKINKEVNNEVIISPEVYDDLMKLINEMSLDLKEIKKDGKQTKQTVFKIDKNINTLVGIEKIKANCKNDNEEKCIEQILKLIEKDFDFKDSYKYQNNVKAWFDFWDRLETLSQDFMSQSEFLYFSIESSNFKDYSPFVLYSCRALEYELLQKVFISYHNYIDNKYSDKDLLFNYNSDELDSSTIKDIESGQMSYFKRKFKSPKYTLGDMRLILNLLPNKDKPKGSKRYQALLALQELNIFINEKIGKIPSKLILSIKSITDNYRNPSAHIGVLDKKKADLFKKEFEKLMNDLLSLFNS